jgi:phosphate transport system substrate-binding protein
LEHLRELTLVASLVLAAGAASFMCGTWPARPAGSDPARPNHKESPDVKTFPTLIAAAALALGSAAGAQAVQLDPKLPEYTVVQGVSGALKSIGSDTMNNEMALWAEGFKKLYPNVQIEIEGKGSSTAPPALVNGTAHFGPMSREMKDKEIDDFEKAFGYKPTALPTSIDMLAVYVHKDNPIEGLTLQQIDAIFSKTRKGGHPTEIKTWGDLGLTGEWAQKPISLYGRNSASGTYGYFKEHALFKGDYRDDVKEQAGSSSVVQAVASDKFAMGYSGIGYKTADVRAVPITAAPGEDVVAAEPANAYSGDYPLSRFLYLYVNAKPGEGLDPLRREFVRYLFSKEGQSEVIKDGYYPVTAKIATDALAQVGVKGAVEAASPKDQ